MKKKIFFIAGEASGDGICEKILQHIKDDFEISGVFGEKVEKMGFKSVFDMKEIAVMGFVEVLFKIFKILPKIKQTIKAINQEKPDLIVTIDSPGFAKTVVSKLRKSGYKGKILHIVAPSVWAYREKRAIKMARLFDELCCFFDFEPKYFEKYGLKSHFIGNISIENELLNIKTNLTKLTKVQEIKTIAITLGSRKMEVLRHTPTICEFISKFDPNIKYIFPTFLHLKPIIESYFIKYQINHLCEIITGPDAINQAIEKCDIAIAKSGTNVLQFLSNFKPTIVYYKLNWLSYLIIKSMLKIKFATLINIMAKKMIVPELIQGDFNCKNLITNVNKINNEDKRTELAENLLKMLPNGDLKPSKLAADIIIKMVKNA